MRAAFGAVLFAALAHPAPAQTARLAVPAFDVARLDSVGAYLDRRSADAFPGAVLVVGHAGTIAYLHTAGRLGVDDPRAVTDSTIYDLASLTKVIGLTTAAMILAAEGKLDLEKPVVYYAPAFKGRGKSSVLVRHLLTHSSGLAAWAPIYLSAADRMSALDSIDAAPLQVPVGTRFAYSDLGAIVLTQAVEAAAGEPLDRFLARRVFEPLAMRTTRYRPPDVWTDRIAPTERDPWRGRVLRGEVHDENAARLEGVSGHAGLFSTGPDLARFTFWLLDAYHDRLTSEAPVTLPGTLVREFTRRQDLPHGSTRALGWDTPAAGGSGGSLLSAESFGHTGFTGTSIWVDPTRDLFIVLLTNRVNPTRTNNAIREVRREVADMVVRALVEGRVNAR